MPPHPTGKHVCNVCLLPEVLSSGLSLISYPYGLRVLTLAPYIYQVFEKLLTYLVVRLCVSYVIYYPSGTLVCVSGACRML